MKEKIAFVCQRYGTEVNGGAELYCRQLAERLLSIYDVEVYTTCAVDYITWADEYASGDSEINGVTVHRYKADRERDMEQFNAYYAEMLGKEQRSAEEESVWIDEQGPVCTGLLKAVAAEHSRYKAVIFMTYLYYLTVKGLMMGLDNAYLIPTLHDEPPVYFNVYDRVFSSPKGIIWNTEAEKRFGNKRFPGTVNIPSVMTGIGIEVPEFSDSDLPEDLAGVPYLCYAGRIDESKGCSRMFDMFLRYKREHSDGLKLVLMGKNALPVPEHPDIIYLGFVSDAVKFAVMSRALSLVLFSQFESLSMVVLESMAVGRPVLVNAQCEVLKDHCIQSNAGLYFENYYEFSACVDYFLSHEAEYEVMRENGRKYVGERYQWDVICKKIQTFLGDTAC